MRDAVHPLRPARLLFDLNQTLLVLAPLQASIRAVRRMRGAPEQAMPLAAHGWDAADPPGA